MNTEYVIEVYKRVGNEQPVKIFTKSYVTDDDYRAPEAVLPEYGMGKGALPGKPSFRILDQHNASGQVVKAKWALITAIVEKSLRLEPGDHVFMMAELPIELRSMGEAEEPVIICGPKEIS